MKIYWIKYISKCIYQPAKLLLRIKISDELSVNDFVYESDEGLLAVAIQVLLIDVVY